MPSSAYPLLQSKGRFFAMRSSLCAKSSLYAPLILQSDGTYGCWLPLCINSLQARWLWAWKVYQNYRRISTFAIFDSPSCGDLGFSIFDALFSRNPCWSRPSYRFCRWRWPLTAYHLPMTYRQILSSRVPRQMLWFVRGALNLLPWPFLASLWRHRLLAEEIVGSNSVSVNFTGYRCKSTLLLWHGRVLKITDSNFLYTTLSLMTSIIVGKRLSPIFFVISAESHHCIQFVLEAENACSDVPYLSNLDGFWYFLLRLLSTWRGALLWIDAIVELAEHISLFQILFCRLRR